ncbi:MAG: MoaD/ThiS family protein [Thermoplasmatales archaeon]
MTRIKIFGEAKEIQIEGGKSGEDLLKELGLSSSSTIILRNGKPIPEDDIIAGEDDVTIIKSFSGG